MTTSPAVIEKRSPGSALKAIIFGTDPKQALRIERLFLASTTYFFGMFIVSYCRWNGLFPSASYIPVLVGALILNLGIYAAIRLDWNLKTRDPSLTLPQMLIASLANTFLVYHTNEARGAFLLGYVLVLVFGIFKLRRAQFLKLGAVVITTYGIIIAIEYISHKPGFNLPVEMLQWLMLIFIYPWFAWIGGYIGNLRRSQKEANERLAQALAQNADALTVIQRQATCDDLTGLYNRRFALDQLRQAKARLEQQGTPFSVLIIDIDHFKRINDTAGHFVGDKALVACVDAIKTVLRATDTFSRWGGEEFLLLMPGLRASAVGDLARRIHASVENVDYRSLGLNDPLSVSIGVAEANEKESIEDMLTAADNALYQAKANGRNRTEYRDA
ncbi:GGDEF domain-containing protein [Noviherbaspirillum galbum]|uniref:diguanylate cyclase n=1 Tax=Noviherbaspirillum galbum TaxID=2709383 RepID=A0A6B3SF59_9BURK|nr:GGDEF domain-containing protein [Noviherbaspirillum galbum]NEX59537.1 GGDEF domain-containing protein [Noviherbaspirillum galbum]